MPTSVEELRVFLDDKEIKYLYDAEKETFIISFTPNVILIKPEEKGEFLQFRTLNFSQYREGKYKANILEMLASINYHRKLVKFGYDPEDGEINACIDIPIEDAEFTGTQFFRCIAALLEALEEARKRLMGIIETGIDPGPKPSKVIDMLVDEIMESLEEEESESHEQNEEE